MTTVEYPRRNPWNEPECDVPVRPRQVDIHPLLHQPGHADLAAVGASGAGVVTRWPAAAVPERLAAVAMFTQRAAVSSGDLAAQDNAPDGPEYQPSAQWLQLP